LSTENDAHRRIVVRRSFEIIHHADVHIHLSDVLVVQLTRLEIEQHEALEQIVVKNQVDVEIFGL
jgi:hypothetical protein